jgi:hypothetical protein
MPHLKVHLNLNILCKCTIFNSSLHLVVNERNFKNQQFAFPESLSRKPGVVGREIYL